MIDFRQSRSIKNGVAVKKAVAMAVPLPGAAFVWPQVAEPLNLKAAENQTHYFRLSPDAEQKNIWQSVSGLQALQEAAQAMPSMTHTRVPQAQSCQSE